VRVAVSGIGVSRKPCVKVLNRSQKNEQLRPWLAQRSSSSVQVVSVLQVVECDEFQVDDHVQVA
jgi:hypothetical protein